jgi:hypothetical protein
MKQAVEIALGGIIYIPDFIEIGSGVRKFVGGRYTDRHTDRKVIL